MFHYSQQHQITIKGQMISGCVGSCWELQI